MKNSEIITACENLAVLIRKGEKYPVKFSYAVTRNFKILGNLMKVFEEERNKLLDQYNVKNKEGLPVYKESGTISIAEEYKLDWEKEIAELLDIEVEFNPHTISPENLPDMIEPDTLYRLDFMIKE